MQIENPLQRRVKGTGLGLPLSQASGRAARRHASTVDEHARRRLDVHRDAAAGLPRPLQADAGADRVDPAASPVLVVEDNDEDLLLYERALGGTRFQWCRRARRPRPPRRSRRDAAGGRSCSTSACTAHESWDLLARLKRDAGRERPVIVVSTIDDRQRASRSAPTPTASSRSIGGGCSRRSIAWSHAPGRGARARVDDEEASRFIMREMLNGHEHEMVEAATGRRRPAPRRTQAPPDVILLDLQLTDMTGFDVLERLRQDPATRRVPVVVVTSQRLTRRRAAPVVGREGRCSRSRRSTRSTLRSAHRQRA